MFSQDDFAKLQFLQGRWKGISPDGKEFYEEYDRPEPAMFRSRRYTGPDFGDTMGDGSHITLENGEVISRWGEFSWRATAIDDSTANFAPLNAPNNFLWRRVDDATLEAEQRIASDGKEQQYTIRMTRV